MRVGRAHGTRLIVFLCTRRRRNTIFKCDWGSDVCSSDLPPLSLRRAPRLGFEPPARARYARTMGTLASPSLRHVLLALLAATLLAAGTAAAPPTGIPLQFAPRAPVLDFALRPAHSTLPPRAAAL